MKNDNNFFDDVTFLDMEIVGITLGTVDNKVVYNLLFLPKSIKKEFAVATDYNSIILTDEQASKVMGSLSSLKVKSYKLYKDLNKKKKEDE